MPLQIPTYTIPYSSTALTNAYASVSFHAVDAVSQTGSVRLNVYMNEASATANMSPIDRITVAFGQTLVPANPTASPPVAAVTFPTLANLASLAAAYATANPGTDPFSCIQAVFYTALMNHPKLAGATLVA